MSISVVRIDDRVIHGQTMTRWTKARPVDGILVVGDNIAHDKLRRKVLKAAANDLKVGIYTVAEAGEKIKKGIESKKKFFLISDSPKTFAQMTDMGIDFGKVLNVGPMNTRPGTKVLGRTVAIDQDDYNAFEDIAKHGIDIQFQLLPDDEIKPWSTMKKKYDSMS
ncbi:MULTISPECIES: PTS system mannose/fructose/N-acetylgalactosamine-transporter subunit IIB [Lactobacillus]|uniref:PTS Man IIB n=1 Tax=Lactobacillus melliventris TaxID=1218507 RepID=A0A0F4LLQ1_9LACO|nr:MULTISPECIES: PTS sugar transporter subunit IIB [Lactobacillus]KJY58476.1 PTS Man IIB [Lactobacillus melliventris]MBC6349537.1 PTS mannose/fructose/sorbose transporter subunit IIB [Lactobacillus melliventris]MBH9988984.1 PTS sugar transporter subunit IIB [Lactobacillus sp. M0392]MBI0023397.1 PTS sugar transporter subunit IIB [Lactobacillus sp. W8171]MBI0043802.1 PTS sugar transporter subunit IIB [Lactobacillus sp. M0393]